MHCGSAKYLVVDTSAFLHSVALHEIAENIYTVPEVIDEIRNRRQFRRLFSLTHDIEVKTVFSESISVVTEFAKKTGDYAALSLTDIKLLALTYQLETQHVGSEHLKKDPVVKGFQTNVRVKEDHRINNGLSLPNNIDNFDRKHKLINSKQNAEGQTADDSAEFDVISEDAESSDEVDYQDCRTAQEPDGYDTANESFISSSEENDDSSQSEDESTDDDTWITPRNIPELKRSVGGTFAENASVTVGCLSSDFAIQNVLMQMGLNALTVDGKIIKQLRTYILRCYACYKTTSNMRKIFCPNCGNKTLKRVSVFIDKNGNKCMYINFKKKISTRGKRFSLPTPKGGKHAVNPRLVEDARRPHQKSSKLARQKTNALEEDYIAGWSPFVMRDVQSKSAQLGFNKGKQVLKNWMRKNPNESKRMAKK